MEIGWFKALTKNQLKIVDAANYGSFIDDRIRKMSYQIIPNAHVSQ